MRWMFKENISFSFLINHNQSCQHNKYEGTLIGLVNFREGKII